MPQDVDLTAEPTHEELLRRVTSTAMPTPPPARPAGLTGTPPLPFGKPIQLIAPDSLMPSERAELEKYGWKEDVPIPTDAAKLIEAVKAEMMAAEQNLPPPIDPRTPPLQVETFDISKLSQDQRARFEERLRTTFKASAAEKVAEAEQAAESAKLLRVHPSVQKAMQVASAPDVEIEDDSIKVTAVGERTTPKPAPLAESKSEASETGADKVLSHCPHCNWDLSMPDIPEPPYGDKLAFLHAILGQKSFTKDYDLFGGKVVVTFRTLTTPEIDVIYKQAYRDRELGRLPTAIDFWERINRLRLVLQLQGLRSTQIGDKGGFFHDLPDGLNREASPNATSFWKTKEPDTSADTPLPAIEKHMTDKVLKTEALFRVVNMQCNQFNRLVARLEAMVNDSDFWQLTEAAS